MSGPAALSCPRCGAPITFGSRFCGYCRGPLLMDHRPVLTPDVQREVHDFAQADPPGPVTKPDFVRGPVGCSFSVGERVTYSGSLPTAWRNGALRLTGSVDGDSGFFSLLARLGQVGGLGA